MKKLLLVVLFYALSHCSSMTMGAEKLASFQLPNQNGTLIKSTDFVGKQPTYLMLWASW